MNLLCRLGPPVACLRQSRAGPVRCYTLRRGSGGQGRYRGGEGIVREIELLTRTQVGLLCDRRKFPPYGLAGGGPGARGRNLLIVDGRAQPLPSKCSLYAPAGAVVRVETPGGGGWGKPRGKK